METWSWTYSSCDRDEYANVALRVATYPTSYRFNDCSPATGLFDSARTSTQPGKFASMHLVRQFHRLHPSWLIWQERYKFAIDYSNSKSPYARCNGEIAELLGKDIKRSIEIHRWKIDPEFKDPDVVTFDPQDRSWQFIEVKRRTRTYVNKWERGQEESLLLLERLVPRSKAVLLYVDLFL